MAASSNTPGSQNGLPMAPVWDWTDHFQPKDSVTDVPGAAIDSLEDAQNTMHWESATGNNS